MISKSRHEFIKIAYFKNHNNYCRYIYKISSENITLIPQFKLVTCLVNEKSSEFKLCIDDILRRIRNMGPVVDSNKAMHCEYIFTILHMALSLFEGLIITP